jgi:hypothetical protein
MITTGFFILYPTIRAFHTIFGAAKKIVSETMAIPWTSGSPSMAVRIISALPSPVVSFNAITFPSLQA